MLRKYLAWLTKLRFLFWIADKDIKLSLESVFAYMCKQGERGGMEVPITFIILMSCFPMSMSHSSRVHLGTIESMDIEIVHLWVGPSRWCMSASD